MHREAFEKWISVRSWFKATIGLIHSDNGYADPCINSRWQGWQAAMRYRDEQEKKA
jgi:hypothetical protein